MQDPDFWRDVATRTIAGILALIFVFLMSLTGGYLKSPDNWPLFLAVGVALLGTTFIALYVYALIGFGKPPRNPVTVDEAAAAIWAKRRARSDRQKIARRRARRRNTP